MPGTLASDDADGGPPDDRPMTLAEHLEELRRRLFRALVFVALAFGVCAYFEDELLAIVLVPYRHVLDELGAQGVPTGILVMDITELFWSSMKLDLVIALFFSGPFVLHQVWGFVARGLYPREKRWVRVFAPVTYVLFLGGTVFYYFVLQPVMLEMMLMYNVTGLTAANVPLEVKPKLAGALSLFVTMAIIMGLVFELPLVMLFLQAVRLVTYRTFARYRRHFLMGALVLAAVATPTGDAMTLALCMVPIVVLFEAGIVLCRIVASDDVRALAEEPEET